MSFVVVQKTNSVNVGRVFEPDQFKDQFFGLVFGVLVSVGIAVGVDVWDAIANAPDAALLTGGFWTVVGKGALVTAIRSIASALGTILGLTIPGVSSA